MTVEEQFEKWWRSYFEPRFIEPDKNSLIYVAFDHAWRMQESRIRQLEEGIRKHQEFTRKNDLTPENIKKMLGNNDAKLYKLIEGR